MRFHFMYEKETGFVTSYSRNGNIFDEDKFGQVVLEITDEEYSKMLLNYDMFIKNGILELGKSELILAAEKEERQKVAVEEMKELMKKPVLTLDDTKQALQKILTFLE